jgi:carotenoid 1,2-hydratase
MSRSSSNPTSKKWFASQFASRKHNTDLTLGVSSAVPSDWGSSVWHGNPWLDEFLQAPKLSVGNSESLSSRGQRSSGTGSSNGYSFGTTGGRNVNGEPCFNQVVPHGGYLWWYVDAISDDGIHGITIIAFVGSVFSPYYAWANQKNQQTLIIFVALMLRFIAQEKSDGR